MVSKSWKGTTAKSVLRILLLAVLPMCASVVVIGCGKGEPRGAVSGEVAFDGKPVETGMVWFEPTRTSVAPRSIPIENGKYRVDEAGGLRPGTYCVRITAADVSRMGHAKSKKSILDQVDFVPLLPPTWNVQSKLLVEVKPGRNVFHFRGNRAESPNVESGIRN
jgi:hypothetical protein